MIPGQQRWYQLVIEIQKDIFLPNHTNLQKPIIKLDPDIYRTPGAQTKYIQALRDGRRTVLLPTTPTSKASLIPLQQRPAVTSTFPDGHLSSKHSSDGNTRLCWMLGKTHITIDRNILDPICSARVKNGRREARFEMSKSTRKFRKTPDLGWNTCPFHG
jgi:hypothetical protein